MSEVFKKIVGHTVGTTMKRADWNETDPKSSAYILNKPDIESMKKDIENFGAAASSALTKATAASLALPNVTETANAALPKSGGTMTGNLDMGGKWLGNLANPVAEKDAATKGYVDSVSGVAGVHLEVNLPASGWSQETTTGKWFQRVNHEDIQHTDQPHWAVVYSGTKEQNVQQQEAFALVDELETNTSLMTFWCFRDKPGIDLTVQLEILRPGSGVGGGSGGATQEQIDRALAQAKDSGEFDGVGIISVAIKEV